MRRLIFSLLRRVVTLGFVYRRFGVLKKSLLAALYISNPRKFCVEMIDIIIEVKLNATNLLKRKTNSNVSQKIIEIREISDKVLRSSVIKIGVAGNRQRKIAYLKDNFTVGDQILYLQKMLTFVIDINNIYKKPY